MNLAISNIPFIKIPLVYHVLLVSLVVTTMFFFGLPRRSARLVGFDPGQPTVAGEEGARLLRLKPGPRGRSKKIEKSVLTILVGL